MIVPFILAGGLYGAYRLEKSLQIKKAVAATTIIHYIPPSKSTGIIFYQPPKTTAPKMTVDPFLSIPTTGGKTLYESISIAHRQTVAQLQAWGAILTQEQLKRIESAFQNIEAHATDSSAWSAVQQAHEITADVARTAIRPPLTDEQWNTLEAHFRRVSGWMPGGENWLNDVAMTAGRGFAGLTHAVAEGFSEIGNALGSIPIIGPAFHGVFTIASGPFSFADRIVQGERLDRALIADFRDKLTGIREVAPYAQTVISFIPGIGQGVSAAIGAGLALAQGKPLDEALVEGIKDALPGGPLARAAFSLTLAAANGENLIKAAGDSGIEALGLDPSVAEGLHKALNVAYAASKGDNIPMAALQEARSYVPTDEGKQAFDVAVAVAQGQRLQDATLQGIKNMTPAEKGALTKVGSDLIAQTPMLQAGRQMVAKASPFGDQTVAWGAQAGATAESGYNYGIGVMRHAGVNEAVLSGLRSKLSDEEQKGFDTAIATYKSAVTTQVPASAPPAVSAAYLATKGIASNPNPMAKTAVEKFFMVSTNPSVRQAVVYAVAQHAANKVTFFGWLKGLVGL